MEDEFYCPACGGKMVRRESSKRKGYYFLGCINFPDCTGKRTLDGEEFGQNYDHSGYDSAEYDSPAGISEDAERWFYAGMNDGMGYAGARDMAQEWQRQEEKDRG